MFSRLQCVKRVFIGDIAYCNSSTVFHELKLRCGSFVDFIQHSVFDISAHSDLKFLTCYLLGNIKISFLLLYLEMYHVV